jgi:hypothetical protein
LTGFTDGRKGQGKPGRNSPAIAVRAMIWQEYDVIIIFPQDC